MQAYEFNKQFEASEKRVAKIKEKQQAEFHKIREIKNSPDLKVKDVNEELAKDNTFGNRLADKVASICGSWLFIDTFLLFLIAWMALNVLHVFGINFDPYPFILLNLFLSCVAAIQAPVIMMSQNRQAHHDKLSSENDAIVNRAASKKLDSELSRLDHQKARIDEIDIKLNLIAGYLIELSNQSKTTN